MRAVVVTRYRCDFCPKGLSARSRMAAHEGDCWKNPAAKSCGSCGNYLPDYGEGDYCDANDDNAADWEHGKPKPRGCSDWKPEPSVCGDTKND